LQRGCALESWTAEIAAGEGVGERVAVCLGPLDVQQVE
jgi:hypothetical protein